ncbi:protein kinase domain-containing protein [Ramlibacter albus]|uniref:Response regulator n=1 Tax=Ramlibacter albus TaxID=2079448 RepID=A0A923M964_9BURK|nr:response regulator [Ramlibacter albus]MBC5765059.1 response regulator [Ramlibacter albus]
MTRRIDRYEVRKEIAFNGVGEICTAFDPVIERVVVIKTLDRALLPGTDAADMVARFRREAIAGGRLTHPGIVTIYEYGEAGDTCFIAMEHAEGPTLRELLTKQGPLALPMVQAIVRHLFAALIYAHEQGVLHRDLKPANIVLTGPIEDTALLRPKILDFGIARIASKAALTHAGTVFGTPGYMAPEQYRGDPTDPRTDIYALGVMLFEMVTGSRTFQGDFAQVVDQVLNRDAPRARTLRPDVPEALEEVIARALTRDPAGRFANMREFREAFIRAVPVVAPPTADGAVAVARAAAVAGAGAANVANAAAANIAAPAAAAPAPREGVAATLPLRVAVRGPRQKLLLLDDEERILAALSALFRLKYDVITATDGHRALELVREQRPDVIISDQRMPRMLGVDFLRQAREVDPASVRILLTGYSDLAAIVGSINDGEVFRFVNKPWSNQEMKDTVAQAMEIAHATRSAAATRPPAQATLPATPQQRAGEAIVVAQPGRELFDLISQAFGSTRPVCHAADVAAVMQAVEDEDVAVLLCDLDQMPGADVMLKLLKQSHPRVQSVALAEQSDSEALISLINEAQILRFLNRPLRIGLLDRALRSALAVHGNLKSAPVLEKRQAVAVKEETAATSIGRQILQRLSMLVRPAALAR